MTTSWLGRLGSSLAAKVDGYFLITDRGSTFGTEFRAGTASFLTMAYLLLVNPQIMTQGGVSHENAVLATALSSAVASLIVGIGGNLPFGLAPGVGLSAYLVYGLVLAGGATLQEALGACFASGILLFIFSLSGISHLIMNLVPRGIKLAIVVGMGILISMIGMVSIKLIVASDKTLVELGDLSSWTIQVALLGVILVGTLIYYDVKGSILIGIAVLTVIFWIALDGFPDQVFELPKVDGEKYLDLSVLWNLEKAPTIYPAIGAFLLIALFDVSGVMFGLASLSGLIQEDGMIPNSLWGFIGSSLGTLVAASLGSTPIIVTVESASGVKEGGRTGLTSVVIGMHFLMSLFLAPLFGAVPEEATAPVLILIGALMMGEASKIDWESMDSALPAFLTIVMMPLTYSITNGMVFGMVMAFAFYITTGSAFRDIMKTIRGERGEGHAEHENWNNRESQEAVFSSVRKTLRREDLLPATVGTETEGLNTVTESYGAA
jgi:AGZA family xanthine/uracil permease-like MFS transporter